MSSEPADLIEAIKAAGVRDERVLDAVRDVPRAEFVPSRVVARAYVDEPLPIPHGQVTTQPSLVARMVEALALDGSDDVLEVGSGHGFQTALLSRLARFIWSIERWEDLAETARTNLARYGVANVGVVVVPRRAVMRAYFVPLVGRHGYAEGHGR